MNFDGIRGHIEEAECLVDDLGQGMGNFFGIDQDLVAFALKRRFHADLDAEIFDGNGNRPSSVEHSVLAHHDGFSVCFDAAFGMGESVSG